MASVVARPLTWPLVQQAVEVVELDAWVLYIHRKYECIHIARARKTEPINDVLL